MPVEPEHQAGAEGVVAVEVADPLQPAGVAEPAADEDPAAVAGALDLAEGVERVVQDPQPGGLEVVDLLVVPVELGASDLLGQRGVVEGVAAVGQDGGADALVEQVLGGGASGLVEVVPGVDACLDDVWVLVGECEDWARRPCLRALKRVLRRLISDGPLALAPLARLMAARWLLVRDIGVQTLRA